MANEPQTPPANPPAEPNADDQEAKFWKSFDERVNGLLDGWLDRTIEKHKTTSPSRMGRTSLPSIFYDAIFGNPAKKE